MLSLSARRGNALLTALLLAILMCATFGAGLLIGVSTWLQTEANRILPTASHTAEVVLVVQTATPQPSSAQVSATAVPSTQAESINPQPTVLPAFVVSDTLVGIRESLRLGKADAPVQIVIFSDPQCPFCKKLVDETEAQLIETYVKTGQAALTYRHFIFLGPESLQIAKAMECAGEQGKFWDFHNLAFKQQFPENSGLATEAAMLDWAKAIKLDAVRFKTCLQDPQIEQRIQDDTELGRKLHVTGTPTLFINGRPMPGALPFSFLKGAIDEALGKP